MRDQPHAPLHEYPIEHFGVIPAETHSAATHPAKSGAGDFERFKQRVAERLSSMEPFDLPFDLNLAPKLLSLAKSKINDELSIGTHEIVWKNPAIALAVMYRASTQWGGLSFDEAVKKFGERRIQREIFPAMLSCVPKFKPLKHALSPQFFEQSLIRAYLAYQLARYTDVSPEDAYFTGLLLDIGHQAMLVVLHESFGDLVIVNTEEIETFLKRYHARTGAMLASRWGCSKEIVCAIREHHETQRFDVKEGLSVGKVAMLADRIAQGETNLKVIPPLQPLVQKLSASLPHLKTHLAHHQPFRD